jgi:hypothetical protein
MPAELAKEGRMLASFTPGKLMQATTSLRGIAVVPSLLLTLWATAVMAD